MTVRTTHMPDELASMDTKNRAKMKATKATTSFAALGQRNLEAVTDANKALHNNLLELAAGGLTAGQNSVDFFISDCRDLAAVRSLQQLFGLQARIIERNLDRSIGYGPALVQTALKAGTEIVAPLHHQAKANLRSFQQAA